jgi:hypothetical protein
MLYELKP